MASSAQTGAACTSGVSRARSVQSRVSAGHGTSSTMVSAWSRVTRSTSPSVIRAAVTSSSPGLPWA
nr:hypothetical protein [Motilibacter aurantiacus]